MRWNQTQVAFSRPIRWLLALHGEHVVPCEYADLSTGRTTRLLRFQASESTTIQDAADYLRVMNEGGILLDVNERGRRIQEEITRLAKEVGGEIVDDPNLLAEVTNLVEKPTAFRGTFDDEFLELPREVLISVMKKHQRYFPIEKKGALLPYFISVRNGGEEHLNTVTVGNENVIRARWKYVYCVISCPSIQTSQPRPQAPSAGCSQLSSTKRISCLAGSMPKAMSESRYRSCGFPGSGLRMTWN